MEFKRTFQSQFEPNIARRQRNVSFEMVGMSKINKEIIIFIFFLTLVAVWGLFMKSPVNVQTSAQEPRVGGLFIEFEEGVSELEVKAILENCSLNRNYIIEYDVDYMGNRYYVKIDKDKRDELSKEENWNDPIFPEIPEPVFPEIKKGNYYYIIVSEEDFENESFLKVMEKNNLQVKKSIVCYILFGDGSQNWSDPKNWIPGRDAIRIKSELEMNEMVLKVSPDDIEG